MSRFPSFREAALVAFLALTVPAAASWAANAVADLVCGPASEFQDSPPR